MTEPTSKDLLRQISQDQKTNAEIQFKEAQRLSNFMNEQNTFNTRFTEYLENNSATNQEGAISKLDRVEKQLISLERKIDKKIAYFTGAGVVLFGLGKWLVAKIFI